MPEYTIRQGLSNFKYDTANQKIYLISDVTIFIGPDDVLHDAKIEQAGYQHYLLLFIIQHVSGVAEPHEERRITRINIIDVNHLNASPSDYEAMKVELKGIIREQKPPEFRVTAMVQKDGEEKCSETNVISEDKDIDIN
jgi:hypothetical protein